MSGDATTDDTPGGPGVVAGLIAGLDGEASASDAGGIDAATLRSRLGSSCWWPAETGPSELPTWRRSGRSAATASPTAADIVPRGARFARVQVATAGEAAELRAAGTLGAAHVVTSFRSRGSSASDLVWRWPLRVAVVGPTQWIDDVARAEAHGRAFDIVEPGSDCEIAIVAADALAADGARSATCVAVVDDDGNAIDALHIAQDVARPVIAIGIAAPPSRWWATLLDALASDLPIDVAAAELRRDLVVDIEVAGPAVGMDVTAPRCWLRVAAPDHPELSELVDDIDAGVVSVTDLMPHLRHAVEVSIVAGEDPVVAVPHSPVARRLGPAPDHRARTAGTTSAAPDADSAPEADPTPHRVGRFVHATLVVDGQTRRSIAARRMNTLRCWIGPDRHESTARSATPTPEPGRAVMLDVDLYIDRSIVSSGKIHLPAGVDQRSSECDLTVPPTGSAIFTGEIAFTLDGRMFELVAVSGIVLDGDVDDSKMPGIEVRSLVHQRDLTALDSRAECHAVIDVEPHGGTTLVRRFGGSSKGVAAVAPSHSLVTKLAGAMYAGDAATARSGSRDDGSWDRAVRTIARHGWMLAKRFASLELDGAMRIEVVDRLPDQYLPLEFVYDRGRATPDATVDRDCVAALRAGAPDCDRDHHGHGPDRRDGVDWICPFGFWSLSRVIERRGADLHTVDGTRSPPVATGLVDRLRPVNSVLAGWSSRLRDEDAAELPRRLRDRGLAVSTAATWADWLDALPGGPSVLLALAHHDDLDGIASLEIGRSTLEVGAELDRYVATPGAPAPMLVLLGCETDAGGDAGHPSFARAFSPYTSVVVATLTKVLGRHAVPFAHRLVDALLDAQAGGGDVGTALLDARRHMFADGHLMSLGVIAIGDADWRLAETA